jgi:uncharacterized protein DUF4178
MSQPAASCPNCGAAVKFRWSGAVQTTCEFCHSILVRRDVDLEKVGVVADLPRDVSPIQIGTEGVYRNKAFQAVGRILYEYEEGGWNEWHIIFQDGASGWLSDAQLEYDVSFQTPPAGPLPPADEIAHGRKFAWDHTGYEVTSVTRAHYRGVEGELPFEYWDKTDVTFADLRTADAKFGTIDYSDPAPILYLGESVEFDDLRLKNLRPLEAAAAPAAAVSGLNCPSCGAPLSVRAAGLTLSVVCSQCNSILDARDPNFQVLQKFQSKQEVQPVIPLGSRGKLHGDEYEVIGFQVRTTDDEGVPDSWDEYVLFNRLKGFRYLTEYKGHWNFVKTVPAVPEKIQIGKKLGAILMGQRYTQFDACLATTTSVLGEFPWRARVGEKSGVTDYIATPRMLSCEITESEAVWSIGEYMSSPEIWQAFGLPGPSRVASGVYANQPSPYSGKAGSVWSFSLLMLLALIVLAGWIYTIAPQEVLLERQYGFSPQSGAEASFVTDPFEVKGHPANVEIWIRTNLYNNWAYFNLALINESTGQGYDFGREVSYYTGRDSDGGWSEGSADDHAIIPSVEPGRYYLRVEPEMANNALAMAYTLQVRRSVPSSAFFWIAAALLLIPPVFATWRAAAFESRRWSTSDYAGGASQSSGDDD